MGAPMAAHLAEGGHQVKAWNRTPGKPGLETAARGGCQIVASAAEAVKGAEVVFACLSDAADLEKVLSDENLLSAAGAQTRVAAGGTVFVDMGTTGPVCAVKMSKLLKARGFRFLDAPVTGGDVGARNATLTIMVGGDRQDFDFCLPLFQLMGKTVRYIGEAGSGQAVKLCNQILCAVNLVGVCEALSLAEQLGIDANLVVEVCASGAAGSWSLANLGPRILKSDFAPGFKIKDMRKDIALVAQAAGDLADKLPGTALADAKFNLVAQTAGTTGGEQGTQAMIRSYSTPIS
jgi:3-hydroxyisobutyrate dehydrogenase